VAILDLERRFLVDEHHANERRARYPIRLMNTPLESLHEAVLLREDDDAWYFVAPVYSQGSDGGSVPAYAAAGIGPEKLGYVYVVMSRDSMREMQVSTFTNNVLITVFFALLLLGLIQYSVMRLTRPPSLPNRSVPSSCGVSAISPPGARTTSRPTSSSRSSSTRSTPNGSVPW